MGESDCVVFLDGYRTIGPKGLERNLYRRAALAKNTDNQSRVFGNIDFNKEEDLCLRLDGRRPKYVIIEHGDAITIQTENRTSGFYFYIDDSD